MPTEQDVVDAIMLDEEVPAFVMEESKRMRAKFHVATSRRGARRVKAMTELQQEIESKLHSQYVAYRGIITSLKIKATKKWIAEECRRQVEVLTHSLDVALEEVRHWKNAYFEQVQENIKLKVDAKENRHEIAGATQDEQ